jgi:uncharacterized C2H2 Zn-finger protein
MNMVKIDTWNVKEFEGDAAFRCAGCGRSVRRQSPDYVTPANPAGNYLKAELICGLLRCPVCKKRQQRESARQHRADTAAYLKRCG